MRYEMDKYEYAAEMERSMNARDHMTEADLQGTLVSTILNLIDARDEIEGEDDDITLAEIGRDMVSDAEGIAHVTTFAEAGLLTGNMGVVLRMEDGSEFQITIVQSREPRA